MNIDNPIPDQSTAAYVSPSPGSESAGVNMPINTDSQQTQQVPDYITKDFANNQYNSLKGLVDRSTAQQQNQYQQLNQTLSPLLQLLQGQQNAAQPDPVAQDPMGTLRMTHQEIAQIKELVNSQQTTISQMLNMYQGGLAEAKINEQFRGDFPSTQDLERAKTLFVNTHKEIAGSLLVMNGNDPIRAFGKYVQMLKAGVFSENQDATAIAGALNQSQHNREKSMQAGFGNSVAGNRPIGNQQVDVMRSFTF